MSEKYLLIQKAELLAIVELLAIEAELLGMQEARPR